MIKRIAYSKVKEVMENWRIPILVGLRRTGKTTILEQLNKDYKNSVLIRMDSIEISSLNDLELYSLLRNQINSNVKVILLDEVQIRKNWDLIIKNLFDEYVSKKQIKVVVTGSSSLTFESKDTGVDRTEKVLISTLDFNEYLKFSNKEKTYDVFEEYLGKGAFPGYVDKDISFDDLKRLTLEPILNDDIPARFKVSNSSLTRLLLEISLLTNGEFNKNRSSKNTGLPITQIDLYLDILEKTQIIKRVYLCKPDGSFFKYPKFKIYINPHFHLWLLNTKFKNLNDNQKGHIVESYWLFASTQINGYYKRYYYIKDQKNQEVDFVSLHADKGFKTLHEFKYSLTPTFNKLFLKLISKNKVIWYKGKSKIEGNIKYESILDYKLD